MDGSPHVRVPAHDVAPVAARPGGCVADIVTPAEVGAVNQAVIAALLARDWAELDRLVPHEAPVDPCPDLEGAD